MIYEQAKNFQNYSVLPKAYKELLQRCTCLKEKKNGDIREGVC